MNGRQQAPDHPLGRSLIALALVAAGAVITAAASQGWPSRADDAPSGRTSAAPAVSVETGPAVSVETGPAVSVETGPAVLPLERPLDPVADAPRAGLAAPSPPDGAGAAAPASTATALRDAVVLLTNERRLAVGCPRLRWDDKLALAGERHARDMIRRNYFAHVSPDGRGSLDRARAAGFTGGVGENLAVGYSTARDVVTGWMNSPGHRANILNCRFTRIGVSQIDGVIADEGARGVWVQELGTAPPDGGA